MWIGHKHDMGNSVYLLGIKVYPIELVEELNTFCIINALRRFLSIQGPVRQCHLDRGTNFVSAVNKLQIVNRFV